MALPCSPLCVPLPPQHGPLLAQPSICRLPGGARGPTFDILLQRSAPASSAPLLLHHTNFVEAMAPTFEAGFFNSVVRHTIGRREFGEWVGTWPAS